MRHIGLIILTFFLIYSCKDNSTKNNSQTLKNGESISNTGLSDIFSKVIQSFPNDSASIYRFYFEWNSTKDPDKINEQIKRLEKLTSKESLDRYRRIETNLKPLMTIIVKSNTISKSQSDSLVVLYSDYDYFSGESLFSKLLTEDDNYDLVWQSLRIMAKESNKDTCFISALMKLEENIRINVELSEAMGSFVATAIENNPTGFLEMYNIRQSDQRTKFANYMFVWDEPNKDLIDKFSDISKNSAIENYRQLATELLKEINDINTAYNKQ